MVFSLTPRRAAASAMVMNCGWEGGCAGGRVPPAFGVDLGAGACGGSGDFLGVERDLFGRLP
jgi:hypothetical protein